MKEAKEHNNFYTVSIQHESMSNLLLSNPRLGGFQ